jgi:hypothetical protein
MRLLGPVSWAVTSSYDSWVWNFLSSSSAASREYSGSRSIREVTCRTTSWPMSQTKVAMAASAATKTAAVALLRRHPRRASRFTGASSAQLRKKLIRRRMDNPRSLVSSCTLNSRPMTMSVEMKTALASQGGCRRRVAHGPGLCLVALLRR